MNSTDKMWQELTERFENSDILYRGVPKCKQNSYLKVCAVLAAILCIKILKEKYERSKEESDDSWISIFGDTSLEAILKSSVFGFVFIVSLTLLGENVVHHTDNSNRKSEDEKPMDRIPSQSIIVFISLIIAEAAELVVESYFENVEGKFELGHFTGIWIGNMITQFFII